MILDRANLQLTSVSLNEPSIDLSVLSEVVCFLLEMRGGVMNIVDLLTTIGLADHIAIAEVGTPISGDDYFILPNGPIPIRLFRELQKVSSAEAPWANEIQLDGTDLKLLGKGKVIRLSRGHRRILESAFSAIHNKSIGDVVEVMNDSCPEWFDNMNKVVHLADVFVVFGATHESAALHVKEVRSSYRTDSASLP